MIANNTVKNTFMEFFSKQKELDFLKMEEEHLIQEIDHLKSVSNDVNNELDKLRSVPLIMGQFVEAVGENYAIVSSTTGSLYYVRISSIVDKSLLKPNTAVILHKHSSAIVGILPPETDSAILVVDQSEKPDVTYADIGGLDVQKQEIREAVELPLLQLDLYKQIGIEPPRGVLLYGPPGTGKTMLVKAVANQTKATFIRVNGSEFVQKYLGEGPRMVRDVFRMAREKAPSIVFIDEVDSIATRRFDAATSADREVQRVLLELLNQMDGFDQDTDVKVIMATNRIDTIDPALLRPGRLDRKIEFPLPDRRQKRLVYNAITSKMSLNENVNLEAFINLPDKLSAAEIHSICQEAGMLAIRNGRYMVIQKDFEEAFTRIISSKADVPLLYK
ncbi:ATP-dependent regulatory subunit of 26S proteasome [Hamiltosporidium magnivora]|uniref:26S proteasome regulatory subunit 6B homolog n=3 Tax=Hamiltosporidium TaxID=1176354 RepID=A0A4Q9KU18_9MICR|nr:ATP-dependent regulatory subunit of 26S proteasome [Hamiltosporidium magnivora]